MPEVRYVGPWQSNHLYLKGDVVYRNGVKYRAAVNIETGEVPGVGTSWVAPEPLELVITSLNTDGTIPSSTVQGGGGAPQDLPTLDALGVATDAELAAHVAAGNPHPVYATDTDLANHEADTTSIHGLANTANVVLTNDSRLADSRTPLSHLHVIGDSTNLQSSLDSKSATTHNHDASYATVGHTHAGTAIPAGLIAMWGGLAANIPAGWLLCDGQNGTPDLRSRFIKGAVTDPGATGGATTHSHTVTQPAAHPLLSHSAHSGATVGNHAFTQPGAHSNHAVTQATSHVFTQPGTHSAHVFTQPGSHSAHAFTQPTIAWPAGVPTQATHTHDAHTLTASGSSGATRVSAPTTHSAIAAAISWPAGVPTNSAGAVDAHSAHSGGAVDAHSAHSGGAVDAHSGTAVDAHSAHSGGAVDAHSVGQASAHSDHASQTHSGAAVDTVNSEPAYYALCFIQKT